MHVDVKVTVWQRIRLPENLTKEQVLENLKQSNPSANDLWELNENLTYENLTDTEEYLTVEQNEGCSTLELYDDNDQLIWNNGTVC